jgi:aspartate/methionine/tyrosine aminotransferase
MWDRSRLALAPGEFFGAPGHIRVGYGQSHQELAEGLALLVAGLREYSVTFPVSREYNK